MKQHASLQSRHRLRLVGWAGLLLAGALAVSAAGADNTGSGGTITYTDTNGLNPVASPPYAGGYVVHTFTNIGSDTFNTPLTTNADVLVVAGGGGGGGYAAGGGGAGGYSYSNLFPIVGGSNYTVTVGGGGAGGTANNIQGTDGGGSVFGSITAVGGGGGGTYSGTRTGLDGGSGGGGSCANAGGAGTAIQGTNGGAGGADSGNYSAAGGGGANGAGTNGNSSVGGGAGGPGKSCGITGTTVWYAGGGGGGTYSGTRGANGVGGGGMGGDASNYGSNGLPNTGGGGGGAGRPVGAGRAGNGGSGIVIVRYALDAPGFPWIDATNGAAGVTMTSVWLQATLTDTGASPTAVWSYWGTNNGGAVAGNWADTHSFGTNAGACPVACSNQATGLSPNTPYYYAFSAVNAQGTNWSAFVSFTTPGPPVINNASGATQVVSSQAKLNGALADGGQAYVWIYWGTTNGATDKAAWARTNSLGILNEGAFSALVTGLQSGTTYYYRCYASNTSGTAWAPTTTNFVAQDIAGAGKTWDGGGGDDHDWTLGANWVGDVLPGRPSSSAIVFNDAGSDTQPGIVKSRLDADWTIYGLAFNYWVGNKYFTFDLGGNTLTLDGGDLNTYSTWNWDSGSGNIEIILTNGTLKVGGVDPANLKVIETTYYGGKHSALTIDCGFNGAKINEVQVVPNGGSAGDYNGTLDMRGATIQAFQVNDKVTIGSSVGPGSKGQMYLRGGSDVYFDKLYMDANATAGSLLRLESTALTVGNSDADGFSVARGKAVMVLDFTSPSTLLRVYGDYRVSGPATQIPGYITGGQIVVTNGWYDVWYDGEYTCVGQQKGMILEIR